MKPSVVFIDIGATLVMGPNRGPAARIGAAIGLDPSQEERLTLALMTNAWENPEPVVAFVNNAIGLDGVHVSDTIRNVWLAQENEATPIEGALTALERLTDAGLRIGIISNIWHPFLTAARRHFGHFVDRHVRPQDQVYSYRQGVAKPSEIVFRRALAAASVEPSHAVMIGDSFQEDIEPAARSGFHTIWLLHRAAKETRNVARALNNDAVRPSRTLASITELEPRLVRELLSGNG